MNTLPIQGRYAVLQRYGEDERNVGVVIANNYSHAMRKAQQLFNRRVWVERL